MLYQSSSSCQFSPVPAHAAALSSTSTQHWSTVRPDQHPDQHPDHRATLSHHHEPPGRSSQHLPGLQSLPAYLSLIVAAAAAAVDGTAAAACGVGAGASADGAVGGVGVLVRVWIFEALHVQGR